MAENTSIEWAHHTFNPWIGCTPVDSGCKNCYAERNNRRFNWVEGWSDGYARKHTSESYWREPLKWNARCKDYNIRERVFPSLCDPFDDTVLYDWKAGFFNLVYDTKFLDWLILTKRPQSMLDFFGSMCTEQIYQNMWLGVSGSDQKTVDEKLDLLALSEAKVRWLSLEPMIAPVELRSEHLSWLNWVVIGGESDFKKPRAFDPDWALSVIAQCKKFQIPVYFKQNGGTVKIEGSWGGNKINGQTFKEFPQYAAE